MAGFDEARRAAIMSDLLSAIHDRSADLLPFDAVRQKLKLKQLVDRGIQEVPMDKIIGTVGREHEFTRAFLPREESLRGRWEELKDVAEGPAGFPPVELYLVRDVYFVVDGHHRISVERSLGAETIEARVKEFVTPLMLTPDSSMEEIVLKAGLADFLDTTGLVQKSPSDFVMTVANGYEKLVDHITVHRYYLGIEKDRSIPLEEAVRSWRENLYEPVIRVIQKSKVLKDFPEHTETDLYLFIMDHLHYLRERYASGHIKPEGAARSFAKLHHPPAKKGIKRRIKKWIE
jgi:hypothetical protein